MFYAIKNISSYPCMVILLLVHTILFLQIGQGTYSIVYKGRDVVHGKVVALKKVRFDNLEPDSVRFVVREISISRRLDHPNIIKLEGVITSRMSCSLYLVFEYMEHDITGIASLPGVKFTEPQVHVLSNCLFIVQLYSFS